jgi:hypothetical protein
MLDALGYFCILGVFVYCCWDLGKIIEDSGEATRTEPRPASYDAS